MSMTAQIAANRISRELNESETELDRTIASTAKLLASMVQARLDTETPIATGQVAMLRLVKSINSLSAARSDLIRTHADLLKVGETRSDLPAVPSDCDPASGRDTGEPVLRIAS
jgi:ABC-type transporter Mla subunit MlaD